jgi:hypothetical protein
MAEVLAYYRAIIRKKTSDTRYNASMIRVATQGSQRNYRAYVRGLDNAQKKLDTMDRTDVQAVTHMLDGVAGSPRWRKPLKNF